MSVDQSKKPQSGFLREFHFSTLAKTAVLELLGDVKLPSWLSINASHVLDATTNEFVFSINVKVSPHQRLNSKHLSRRRVFLLKFGLQQNFIEQFREEVPKLFVTWVHKELLENAYRLYESDPRIGWVWDGTNGLPVCPLFDPPKEFSRTGLPLAGVEGSTSRPSCSFCRGVHTRAELPVWGGANLMWVHSRCLEGVS